MFGPYGTSPIITPIGPRRIGTISSPWNRPESGSSAIESWAFFCITYFMVWTSAKVRTEMSLQVLACNMKRMIQTFGVGPLMAAIRA